MKKIVAGFLIATSLVALAGCKKAKKPEAMNTTAPVEAAAGNNMSAAMTNASGNESSETANGSNNMTVDPHGSSGGH